MVWIWLLWGLVGNQIVSRHVPRGDVLDGINRAYRPYPGPGTRGLAPAAVARRIPGWPAGPPIG
jgi:hypothetical protein